MVADSTAGHLPLSPLASSCCVAYQLKSTTKHCPLQGFQQSLVAVSPLHSAPLCSTPLSIQSPLDNTMCGKLGVLTVFHPGSSNHTSPYIILLSLILLQIFFPQFHFQQLNPLRLKIVVNSFVSKKGRDTCQVYYTCSILSLAMVTSLMPFPALTDDFATTSDMTDSLI